MAPSSRWASVLLVVALLLHGLAVLAVMRIPGRPDGPLLVTRIELSWLTYALALLALALVPLRRTVLVVALVGAALLVPAVLVEPQTSSDSYRYVWDGRVQLSGVSPYRYVPDDEALRGLRDAYLWPQGPDGESEVGRSTVPTIYPPVAQAWFAAVAAVFPTGTGGYGIRIATALLGVGVTVLLGRLMRKVGQDPRWAAVWAWCPLVVFEAGNNAHVDVLSTAFVVLGFAALHGRRHVLAGVFLGLAVATKLVPLVVAPVFARERPVRVGAGAVTAVVLPYLPHLLAVGSLVVGFLPGYLAQEGYDGTRRFHLVRLVVPDAAAPWVAVGLGAVIAVVAWRLADPRRPWVVATWLSGAALLVVSPTYHWYALTLVACVALSRRVEWLLLPAAIYVVYLAPDYYDASSARLQVGLYSSCLAVVLGAAALRHRRRLGPLLLRLSERPRGQRPTRPAQAQRKT